MRLGYILSEVRGEADRLLAGLATQLQAEGRVVAGVVQSRAPSQGAHPCDMELAVLPEGPGIEISQRLGGGARGCRLDTASLEEAAGAVAARLAAGADVLILNKFGAQEASGRGFCPVLAQAMEQGIPALTAVNARNLESFLAFAGRLETRLAAEPGALQAWVRAALAA
ncbi:DUF2478 domain-containing protein [Vannielia litorea]|uniref:DUF2478 domain-containing protein n=1 Tax=Vannielia litorea TaxID=1217970 RepID=UPI001BCF79CF|nr:DUF2478 domain-containing protein [Vannielia litorea]MBS8226455.1 DUF2478 domain-containing protein [Vannielia litorea]